MKELKSLLKYFNNYKWLLIAGLVCIVLQNIFQIFIPISVRSGLNGVVEYLKNSNKNSAPISSFVIWNVFTIIGLALVRGIFMFLMRQTIIVMSRRIEFDQRNDIYNHYQSLDTKFYKKNRTGDLMARLTEDVSRVRNFIGPALMYAINLIILIFLVVYFMFHVNAELALFTLLPLPVLSLSVYFVVS